MEYSETQVQPDPFAENTSVFLQWFTASPGTRLSDKIQLADLRSRDAGRGVIALQDIAEDEELFAIPGALVLTTTTSDIPKQILEELDTDDAWLPLIITIIYEYLRQDASPWYPYFQILPTYFNTLMFWSEDELAELQASAVVSKIGKAEAEDGWNKAIIPLMLKHPNFFPVGVRNEDYQRKELIRHAHMAGSLIMAYAFDIDRDDGNGDGPDDSSEKSSLVEDEEDNPIKGMIPLADMLNADADRNNARLFQENGYLVMKVVQPIKAGHEIFNDYGPLPRSDLLRMYGYITDNYAQYDVVEISYDLIMETAKSQQNPLYADSSQSLEEMLDACDLIEEGYIISRPPPVANLEDAISGQLHMLLRVLCGGSPKHGNWTDDESIAKFPFTTQEATMLSAILSERLSEYSTTVDMDKQLISDVRGYQSENLPASNRGLAIQIRLGEKEIAHAVLQMCKKILEPAANQASNGTKKRAHGEDGSSAIKSRKAAHTQKRLKL